VTDQDWEQFARDNPLYYIRTDYRGSEDEFWGSGRRDAEHILASVRKLVHTWDRVVEIGCGFGRILVPMASYYRQCVGVDISDCMLAGLRESAEGFGVADRVDPCHAESDWDKAKADLVYSLIVFQHIEDLRVIEQYVARIAGCIEGRGVAYLQFDTRPATLAYRLRNSLPDFLLPRSWRRGIRRIRRSRADLARLFGKHGLSVVREEGADTEYHVFILRTKAEGVEIPG